MKLYRAIIQEVGSTSYKGTLELFESEEAVKQWFKEKEERFNKIQALYQNPKPFPEVLAGSEEVDVK